MFKSLFKGFCDLVYPSQCLTCLKQINHPYSKGELCPSCFDQIILNKPPFCRKCSRHMGPDVHIYCKSCRENTIAFDFAWCCCTYDNFLRPLIHQFKYKNALALRWNFFELMKNFIEKYHLDIDQFDIIIPIPLHPLKQRSRGYNPAEILSELIARHYSISINKCLLIRQKYTKPQYGLAQKERWTNIQGAFKIKASSKIEGKNILLIDDLLTTGSTVSHAAKALKDANAQTVGVLSLAVTL